ncbi:lytic murein transglycosylase [Moraxella nasovis]|uniref:lytic murein transglycosylase n=1 Tax=Moraxella nasovis TaxID=2904121 RepID=UPI001F61B14B|nr:lytic murein transglycosylase [Moraxella nasovis]UNU73587.1 lytic murein transglycosylase [Moraxella nasovis]
MRHHTLGFVMLSLSASVLMACQSSQTVDRPPIQIIEGKASVSTLPKEVRQPAVVYTPKVQHIAKEHVAIPQQTASPKQMHYASFSDWKADFIRRAALQGYDTWRLENLLSQADYLSSVISLDRSQAEFTKMPWEYVESAVSHNRIQQGRSKLNAYRTTLADAESRYGVPKQIVAAIWGMESSYGTGMGNTDLVSALATLAYDGRRREFAEGELIAMMRMVERGDVSPNQLKGSWAGGMGHTQFIPSTWLLHGVDANGDGYYSPWQASDALSSTANYLGDAGWVRGLAPYYEVSLPTQFDYRLIGQKQSLDLWRQAGVLPVDEPFYGAAIAELWLPAGIHGPALLITQNFDVIRVYNNSSSYALGVSLLAKRIGGGEGLSAAWPKHERPLSRTQVKMLQQKLTALGFDTQGIDGVAGSNTKKAFAKWQTAHGQIPDGFISLSSADALIW